MARSVNAEILIDALTSIRDLEPRPFAFPSDWHEQIKACPECERYRGHPIQRGICNEHRRPLWQSDDHRAFEEKAMGSRAKVIASDALTRWWAGADEASSRK